MVCFDEIRNALNFVLSTWAARLTCERNNFSRETYWQGAVSVGGQWSKTAQVALTKNKETIEFSHDHGKNGQTIHSFACYPDKSSSLGGVAIDSDEDDTHTHTHTHTSEVSEVWLSRVTTLQLHAIPGTENPFVDRAWASRWRRCQWKERWQKDTLTCSNRFTAIPPDIKSRHEVIIFVSTEERIQLNFWHEWIWDCRLAEDWTHKARLFCWSLPSEQSTRASESAHAFLRQIRLWSLCP